jgi:hypothetical protein
MHGSVSSRRSARSAALVTTGDARATAWAEAYTVAALARRAAKPLKPRALRHPWRRSEVVRAKQVSNRKLGFGSLGWLDDPAWDAQNGVSGADAAVARLLGVSQPRISDLMRAKVDKFPSNALVEMPALAATRASTALRCTTRLSYRACQSSLGEAKRWRMAHG